MNCMKCGKKTEGSNVFCGGCLSEMERYPVRPGTTVHIPARAETPERKPVRRIKERSPEEQITALHKLVQFLVICLATLSTTLAIAVGVLVYTLAGQAEPATQELPVGRNYSTSAPVED